MRKLTAAEARAVQGGILPLLLAGAAVMTLSGCATARGGRRGERPADSRIKRP